MDLAENLKLKRLIKELKSYRGRHTEFVSIYVPSGYELSKITQNLRDEKQTATNIKDAKTSKSVQQALEKAIQTLILIERTPQNGIALFSGNISEKDNVDNFQVFWVEPKEKLNLKLYRCNQKFIVEPLEEMSLNEERYGLVAMDKGEAIVGVLVGSSIKKIRSLTSNVPGKHKSGGQSAQRFERIREGAAVEFYKRVADVVIAEFTYDKNLMGILIGGPGTTKNNFFDGTYLNEDIKKKVLMPILDVTYTNEQGLKELTEKGEEILKNSDIKKERDIVNKFLETLSKKTEMICYGEDNVVNALNMGAIDTLIIIDEILSNEKLEKLANLCEMSKSKIEIISDRTSESKQLLGLSGIGAILRYPI